VKKELNEGLIFINLTNTEFDLLKSHLNQSMSLSTFLNKHEEILSD